jgi:protein-S-isoprenylcysteine O-methyltransferase Ste14
VKVRYYAWRGYVLVLLLFPLLAARLQSAAPVNEVWLLLVLAGAWLRLWAGVHIGPHSNGTALVASPRARTGPYRFLRHPLYASNLAVAAGLIGYANCLSAFSAAALWTVCLAHHLILIRFEQSLAISGAASAVPAGWKSALGRQGRNLAYTFGCVALLSLVSRFSLPLFP